MNVRDLFNPKPSERTPAESLALFLGSAGVPARCPPCGAELWAAVRREWDAAGRIYTALEVEAEVGRRHAAMARRRAAADLFDAELRR